MSILDQVKPLESFSLWGAQSLFDLRTPNESIPKKVIRIALSEPAFVGLALLGLVETVVKAIIFAVVKTLSYMHPDKESFRNNYVLPALKELTFSEIGTAQSLAALILNFFDHGKESPIYVGLANSIGKSTIYCAGEFDNSTVSGTPVSWFASRTAQEQTFETT